MAESYRKSAYVYIHWVFFCQTISQTYLLQMILMTILFKVSPPKLSTPYVWWFMFFVSINSMLSIATKALLLNTWNILLKTKDYTTHPPTTDLHTLTVVYTSHSFRHMNIIHRRLSCMKRLRDRTVYNQTVVQHGMTPINM